MASFRGERTGRVVARAGTVVFALVVVGVAVHNAAATPTPEEVPAGPDPAVQEWTGWPFQVACNSGPFDPNVVFAGPTNAELGSDPAAAELRRILSSPENQTFPEMRFPPHHWRLLTSGPDYVEFFQGRLGGKTHSVVLRLGPDGWSLSGHGGCTPTTIVNGRWAADWGLFRDAPKLSPAARVITLWIRERQCTGSANPIPRLRRPTLVEFDSRLVITFSTRPLPGRLHHCGANPACSYRLRLPFALSNRTLFNGSTFPPSEVAPTPRAGSSRVTFTVRRRQRGKPRPGPRRSRFRCGRTQRL